MSVSCVSEGSGWGPESWEGALRWKQSQLSNDHRQTKNFSFQLISYCLLTSKHMLDIM